MDDHMNGPRKPRSSNDLDGPHIELVPNGAKEAQLMMLFETYGERYTARRLAAYVEDLEGIDLPTLAEAIRTWRRATPPHRQAPSPAELVQLARQLAEREQQRATPPLDPPRQTPHDLDAIFAELAREQPHNAFLKWMIAERGRLRAEGRPLDMAATLEAMGARLSGEHRMPAVSREPGEDDA